MKNTDDDIQSGNVLYFSHIIPILFLFKRTKESS